MWKRITRKMPVYQIDFVVQGQIDFEFDANMAVSFESFQILEHRLDNNKKVIYIYILNVNNILTKSKIKQDKIYKNKKEKPKT